MQIEDELERAKKAHDEFVNSWYDLNDLAQVCLDVPLSKNR